MIINMVRSRAIVCRSRPTSTPGGHPPAKLARHRLRSTRKIFTYFLLWTGSRPDDDRSTCSGSKLRWLSRSGSRILPLAALAAESGLGDWVWTGGGYRSPATTRWCGANARISAVLRGFYPFLLVTTPSGRSTPITPTVLPPLGVVLGVDFRPIFAFLLTICHSIAVYSQPFLSRREGGWGKRGRERGMGVTPPPLVVPTVRRSRLGRRARLRPSLQALLRQML